MKQKEICQNSTVISGVRQCEGTRRGVAAATQNAAIASKQCENCGRSPMRRWFLVLGSKRLETTEAWISFYLLLLHVVALVTIVLWSIKGLIESHFSKCLQ